MNAIRIKTHIDSETLHLPELREMIGKDVEIVVSEEKRVEKVETKPKTKLKSQGNWFDQNFGCGWPDEKNDGFEDAVRAWRDAEKPRAIPE